MKKVGFVVLFTAKLDKSELETFKHAVQLQLEDMKIDDVKVSFISEVEDLVVDVEKV